MSDQGRGVEREIGRVLEALGGVEAPLGLEGRVLARVAEARGRRRGVGWVPGVVLAGVCVMAGVVWVGAQREGRVVPRQMAAGGAVSTARTGDGVGRSEGVRGAASGFVERRGAQMATRRVSVEEMRAREEMRAPSMPEEPVPITAQERLLVRVAQGRGAEALAKAEDGGADEDAVEVEAQRKPTEARDVASVIEAGLFAGMKAGADE